jgi:hypothetical protein
MEKASTRPSGANDTGLPLAEDMMRGAGPLAEFFYGEDNEANRRKIYHLSDKHGLPTFKLGGVLCGRRSTIMRWVEQQEGAA